MNRFFQIFISSTLIIIGFILLLYFLVNIYITHSSKSYIQKDLGSTPSSFTGLVLGAGVYKNGSPSPVLRDRLETAYELYRSGKIKKLLLSGDHGGKYYDEVNTMKGYLESKGVPQQDIFLDHAGFDTYNSITRANKIFLVDDMIIITQQFHLPRAIYIAKEQEIKVAGISADKRKYMHLNYLKFRESLANIKAFFETIVHRKPRFLGEKIPITGDSKASYDK